MHFTACMIILFDVWIVASCFQTCACAGSKITHSVVRTKNVIKWLRRKSAKLIQVGYFRVFFF